jgi:hypothetical protein
MIQRDIRNTIISLQETWDIYGVILRTDTDLWDVGQDMTRKKLGELE